MLAETYIQINRFIVEELHLSAEPITEGEGCTYVEWRGITDAGAVRVAISLHPAGDAASVTLYDNDVEVEHGFRSTNIPSVDWVGAALTSLASQVKVGR